MIRPDSYPNSLGPDASHQFGSYKDETGVGANDGTGLFKDQMMDAVQWIWNLMTKFVDTPSDAKEDATTSEALEFLEKDITLFAGNVNTINVTSNYTVAADNKNGVLRCLAGIAAGTVTLVAGAGIDDGSRLTIINESGGTVTVNPGGITLLDDERILLWYNSHTTSFDSLLGDNVIIGTLKNINATDSSSKTTGSVVLSGGIGVGKNIHAGGTIKNDDATDAANKDSGAIITEGGIGVEKNIHAGGTIKNDDATASSSKDTGAIITEGGVGVEKEVHAGLTITSDVGTKRGTAGIVLREKVLSFSGWDMDTTATKNVAHGLGADYKKIRSIKVMIRDNTDNLYRWPLTVYNQGTELNDGGIWRIDTTNVSMQRTGGGTFDAAGFNGAGARGEMYILYAV